MREGVKNLRIPIENINFVHDFRLRLPNKPFKILKIVQFAKSSWQKHGIE